MGGAASAAHILVTWCCRPRQPVLPQPTIPLAVNIQSTAIRDATETQGQLTAAELRTELEERQALMFVIGAKNAPVQGSRSNVGALFALKVRQQLHCRDSELTSESAPLK